MGWEGATLQFTKTKVSFIAQVYICMQPVVLSCDELLCLLVFNPSIILKKLI